MIYGWLELNWNYGNYDFSVESIELIIKFYLSLALYWFLWIINWTEYFAMIYEKKKKQMVWNSIVVHFLLGKFNIIIIMISSSI